MGIYVASISWRRPKNLGILAAIVALILVAGVLIYRAATVPYPWVSADESFDPCNALSDGDFRKLSRLTGSTEPISLVEHILAPSKDTRVSDRCSFRSDRVNVTLTIGAALPFAKAAHQETVKDLGDDAVIQKTGNRVEVTTRRGKMGASVDTLVHEDKPTSAIESAVTELARRALANIPDSYTMPGLAADAPCGQISEENISGVLSESTVYSRSFTSPSEGMTYCSYADNGTNYFTVKVERDKRFFEGPSNPGFKRVSGVSVAMYRLITDEFVAYASDPDAELTITAPDSITGDKDAPRRIARFVEESVETLP